MSTRITACLLGLMLICSIPASAQVGRLSIAKLKPANDYSRVALKTNLLYDAVLVPNIGVEAKIFNNWTIYADIMYARWDIPSEHFYWDLYGAQAGIRKYFGSRALHRSFTGHHAGIYTQALAYDFQAGNIGQQTPTINFGVGVEYGYSFPVARSLNIDVEIGIGYLGGKYHEYTVEDTHNVWRGTLERTWIGPTKASISLVWLIKSKQKQKQK